MLQNPAGGIITLPLDIWRIILCQYIPRLQLQQVCQIFRTALHDIKHLTIIPNEAVRTNGLMNIINRFPLLKSVTISHCKNERLMHQVCFQFTGSILIERIAASSDLVVPGALLCPKLKMLALGYQANRTGLAFGSIRDDLFRTQKRFNPHERRDIVVILDNFQFLETLEIDNPTLWSDQFVKTSFSESLRKLRLTSLSQSALDCLILSFKTAKSPLLPNMVELYIDMDYVSIVDNAAIHIAKACPLLEKLRLKFAVLGDSFLYDVCNSIQNLKSLKLTNCQVSYITQSWSHVVRYIASSLLVLDTLSIAYCTLNYIDNEIQDLYTGVPSHHFNHFKLRSLKLFDITESRPDASVLHQIITLFPNLTCLRMDLGADCFPPTDLVFIKNVRENFHQLTRLETRFAKFRGGSPEKARIAPDCDIGMPHLKALEIWSCRSFPNYLFSPNLQNITKLSLYCVPSPDPNSSFKLPNLEFLSVQSMGGHGVAQRTCVEILLAMGSLRLKSVNLDAITTHSIEFSFESFQKLITQSPNLERLHFEQFTFVDVKTLNLLKTNFKNLISFQALGDDSFGMFDIFTESIVNEFIAAHRKLERLHFSVSCIEIKNFEIIQFDQLNDYFNIASSSSCQDSDSDAPTLLQITNAAVYQRYSKSFAERFWWLKDISIKGPLN